MLLPNKSHAQNFSMQFLASETEFVYDTWNLIAELNGELGLKRIYVWGTADFRGSRPGWDWRVKSGRIRVVFMENDAE